MYRVHMKRSRLCHSVIWRWVSQTIMYPCSVLGLNQFPCQFRMCATLEMECSLHAMVRLETFLLISVDCMVLSCFSLDLYQRLCHYKSDKTPGVEGG